MLKEFIPLGGVLPDPIENEGKNWPFLGADDDWPVINETGDWKPFMSPPERQDNDNNTRYPCVSISLAGGIEKYLNWLMFKDPTLRLLFDSLGLLDTNGYADVSECFIAKGSGTIPNRGNSQYAVYQFVKNNGFVGEKDWPSTLEMSEEFYYRTLTPEIRAKGKKVLEYIGFNYKDAGNNPDFRREGLKRSSECAVVGGAYLGNEQGALLYRNDGTPSYNHQLQIYRQDRDVSILGEVVPVIDRVEDSYDPLLKDYAGTYPFKYVKIIKLTIKKKLNMTQIYRQTGQRNCYLYIEQLDSYFRIEDSDVIRGTNEVEAVVAGGDLVKPFAGGVYPNIPERDIPAEKVIGGVRAVADKEWQT